MKGADFAKREKKKKQAMSEIFFSFFSQLLLRDDKWVFYSILANCTN